MKLLPIILLCGLLAACVTEKGLPEREVEPANKRAQLHAQLAANYLQRNQLDVSLEEVQQALALDPSNLSANYIMALIQLRFREPDKAESYFRKASVKAGEGKSLPNAQHDYANFLCKRDDFGQAEKMYKLVLENPLYPSPDKVLLNLGECYLRQDKLAEAEQSLRLALKANPKQATALYLMSRISFRAGKPLATRAWYQRYFEVGPDSPEILYIAYRTETALGDKDAAASMALRLKGKFPESEQAAKLRRNR